jgi:hypothetical protein
MNSKNKNVKKFNADMQNQPFQIPVFPQMLNRDLVEQPEQRVLGATTLYQAQSQMRDVPCKFCCPVVHTVLWQINVSPLGDLCETRFFLYTNSQQLYCRRVESIPGKE